MPKKSYREPNQNIKKILKKKGIPQVKAAFQLNINQSIFNQYANGYRIPGAEHRALIAEYLSMPENELFIYK